MMVHTIRIMECLELRLYVFKVYQYRVAILLMVGHVVYHLHHHLRHQLRLRRLHHHYHLLRLLEVYGVIVEVDVLKLLHLNVLRDVQLVPHHKLIIKYKNRIVIK